MKSSASKGNSGNAKNEEAACLRALCDCEELYEIEKLLQRFNLFEVMRSSDIEIRHSNVLAWLFDPKESHGFGDSFLRKWLVKVFSERLQPSQIERASLDSVAIRREWDHIDILIETKTEEGKPWAICVENKIHSQQREDQLFDYRKVVERHYPDPARRGFVFLTRWNEKPADEIYANASYVQIVEVLKECLSEHGRKLAKPQRLFIQHYRELLEERFMDTSKVGELAQKIYNEHKKALDIILEHRPDSSQKLTDAVGKLMRDRAKSEGIVLLPFSNKILRFVPESWYIKANRVKDEDDWCHVFCQIGLWKPYPILQAVMETKGRTQFARRVQSVAEKLEFPKNGSKSSSEKDWYEFYQVKGTDLGLVDVSSDEVESKAEEVWKWGKRQIAGTDFVRMHKEIRKLLPRLK